MKIATRLRQACLLLLLASTKQSSAQSLVSQQQCYGSLGTVEFQDMKLTKDNGLIVCASGYGSGYDKTDAGYGTYDYWIIKLNKNGTAEWNKALGTSGDEHCNSIIPTRDGGYIVGGTAGVAAGGTKTSTGYGSSDYWIVKLDASGNVQWDRCFGSAGTEMFGSLDTTTDGGYIIAGSAPEGISGVKTENGYGGYDYWVLKLDANGNTVWNKTIGGSSDDFLSQVKHTSDGGYILGGNSGSHISGNKTEDSRGDQDYWMVKLRADGSIAWNKTIGGSGFDNLYSVIQTPDGGYLGGGQSESGLSGDKTEASRGGADLWVVKLDAGGHLLWNKTIGGSDYEDLGFLTNTRDGGFAIAGSSISGISGDKTEANRGGYDYWLVKLTANGVIVGDKTFGGNSFDECWAVTERKKNEFLLGGQSLSGSSGDRTVDHKGFYDSWIVDLKFGMPSAAVAGSSAVDIQANKSSFVLYPNPAHNILHVQVKGSNLLLLTNASGRQVLSKTITNSGDIDVSNLPAGVYYLKNSSTGESQKVLVVK